MAVSEADVALHMLMWDERMRAAIADPHSALPWLAEQCESTMAASILGVVTDRTVRAALFQVGPQVLAVIDNQDLVRFHMVRPCSRCGMWAPTLCGSGRAGSLFWSTAPLPLAAHDARRALFFAGLNGHLGGLVQPTTWPYCLGD